MKSNEKKSCDRSFFYLTFESVKEKYPRFVHRSKKLNEIDIFT